MVHEVVVPILDQTGDEVVLVSWLKNEGDVVQPGDLLCSVETAKAIVDIEAEAGGILRRQLIDVNQSIPAHTVVALIADADEELPDINPLYRTKQSDSGSTTSAPAQTAAIPPTPEGAPSTASTPAPGGRIKASPRAKKLAAEHGIDLANVIGTGPGGSIVENDILNATERAAAPATTASAPPAATTPSARVAHAKAQRVADAWRTIPHFYMSITVDLTNVVARKERDGAGVTYTDYVTQAIAQALETTPELNGHWVDDHLQMSATVHLGIVVQTARGLIIPALRDLGGRSITDIAAERQRLIEGASSGKLSGADLSMPTFTVSNVGPGDIDDFTAIISPPQVAILAVGSIKRRPIVVGDELAVRPTARFTLGADHRAIDGRQSAAFLNRLKTVLEQA